MDIPMLKNRRGRGAKQPAKTAESVYRDGLVSAPVPIFYFGTPEVTNGGYQSVPLCGSGVHNPSILIQPERLSFIDHDSPASQEPGRDCLATMDLDVELNPLDMEHITKFENEMGKAAEELHPGQGLLAMMNCERHTMRCWMTRRDRREMEMWHNRWFKNVTHFRIEWSWLHCGFAEIFPSNIAPGESILFPELRNLFVGPPRAIPVWPSEFAGDGMEELESEEEPPTKRQRGREKNLGGVTSPSSPSSHPSLPEVETEMDSSTRQTRAGGGDGERKKRNKKTVRPPAMTVEQLPKKKRQPKRKRDVSRVETVSFALGDDPNGDVVLDVITSGIPSSTQNSSGSE